MTLDWVYLRDLFSGEDTLTFHPLILQPYVHFFDHHLSIDVGIVPSSPFLPRVLRCPKPSVQ